MGHAHHHPKPTEQVHVHPHGAIRAGQKGRLLWVLVLTGVTMVGEIVGGVLTRSVSLLSDAFHMLTHFGAIGLSYLAVRVALKPAAPERSYRNWRYEVIASLFNGILLAPVAIYILVESYQRLRSPVTVTVGPMLVVAVIGLVVNIICAAFLHRHAHHDLNIKSAFVHMVADSLSSVGVMAAGGLIWLGGAQFTWADPAAAALIAVMILVWSVSLMRESIHILLEGTPGHIDLDEVRALVLKEEDIADLHDIHIWTITSKMHAMTAHVQLKRDMSVADTEALGQRLRHALDHAFDINHATLQFEIHPTKALSCEHDHHPDAHEHHHP